MKRVDLAKPKINSSRQTEYEIKLALDELRVLPKKIDKTVRASKKASEKVEAKASVYLNAGRSSKVFKDLILLETSDAVREDLEKKLLDEYERIIEPPKPKDWEPNLMDYQKPEFVRVRLSPPSPPRRPTKGVSVPPPNNDHSIFQDELYFQQSSFMMY